MKNRIIIISPRENDGVGLYAKRFKTIFSDYEVLILSINDFKIWLTHKSYFYKSIIN